MCGIVGILHLGDSPVRQSDLTRMLDSIPHRGPDGVGEYADGPVRSATAGLSIIDLSDAGDQPMANENGDVVIIFNGEIYNFQSCASSWRRRPPLPFRTDTEVIVHGYEEWGDAASSSGSTACSRSRSGTAAAAGCSWPATGTASSRSTGTARTACSLFASEIKAILTHPAVSAETCRYPALNEYFTFQNIFTDLTLFEGIRLLPPGTYLTVDPTASRRADQPLLGLPVRAEPIRLGRGARRRRSCTACSCRR